MQASLQKRGLIWRKDFYTKKIFQKFALNIRTQERILEGDSWTTERKKKNLKFSENNFEKETKKILNKIKFEFPYRLNHQCGFYSISIPLLSLTRNIEIVTRLIFFTSFNRRRKYINSF